MGKLKGGLAAWQAAHKKMPMKSPMMSPADMAISARIEKVTKKKKK